MSESKAQPPEVLTVLKTLGVQQKDVAHAFGVTNTTVSRWVHGVRPIPPFRLHDLWAMASVVREALARGQTTRQALDTYHPTRVEWRTSAFTASWTLPAGTQTADHVWGIETFRHVLMQPGGVEAIALHDATANLDPERQRVVDAVKTAREPSARDLETLRHGYELALHAVYAMQERLAQQPLPEGGVAC